VSFANIGIMAEIIATLIAVITATVIITRCPTTFPGMGQRARWELEDPAQFVGTEEEKLEKFREIRDEIRKKVEEWVDHGKI